MKTEDASIAVIVDELTQAPAIHAIQKCITDYTTTIEACVQGVLKYKMKR